MAEKSDKKDTKDTDTKSSKPKTKKKGTLSLKAPVGGATKSRQGVAIGRSSKPVAVEVKKKRGAGAKPTRRKKEAAPSTSSADTSDLRLTDAEREARTKALQRAQDEPKDSGSATAYQTKVVVKNPAKSKTEKKPKADKKDSGKSASDLAREEELAKLEKINEEERNRRAEASARLAAAESGEDDSAGAGRRTTRTFRDADKPSVADEINKKRGTLGRYNRGGQQRRRSGKVTVSQVLNDKFDDRDGKGRSLASQRRARARQKAKMMEQQPAVKQYREVTLPEAIPVQELANRMTERVGDVVKKLMELGIMATANQTIDADTAELIIHEFGHTVKRVSESDVELGILGEDDNEKDLKPRPPVVTIMGHVDHGKTSLLDAMRTTNVVSGEAGGITQHIGAYQIQNKDKKKITFIDTPGHAAFTEMRARGADITDIVILVVAADDSIMPQTVEAISHAKAAEKPIIVAINKCDLPEANPLKVRQDLLQHEIVTEDMGGDTQFVEVSAHTKQGLPELEEAILLQAEVMDLRANPDRTAIGAVVEARQEQGKGSVATVLIQRGTLKKGDIFITGTEWGRVRAVHDDHGKTIKKAIPGQPVEILGLNGTPDAGDDFVVVVDEAKAREISEFRTRRKRALHAAKLKGRGIDQMIQDIQAGTAKDLPILIKGDVHGSVEAIASALQKITADNTEVKVKILHTGVGAITESDVTLANASNALIIGFNVRANPQARDMAKRDSTEIRYYSIIYEAIDDVKGLLGGMLSPELRENFIGYAEIRQIFNMSKYGKVAGCFVTEGLVKRGAKVRLLRDNVVIHEGTLKTLRRFKDEVKEVQNGYECGMAFENYEDIKEGDVIEAFEIEEVNRTLADAKKTKKKVEKKEETEDDNA